MSYMPKSAVPESEYKPKSAEPVENENNIINTLTGVGKTAIDLLPTAGGIASGIVTSPFRQMGIAGRGLNAVATGIGTGMVEGATNLLKSGVNEITRPDKTLYAGPGTEKYNEFLDQTYVQPIKTAATTAALTFGTGEVLSAIGKMASPVLNNVKNISKNLMRSLVTVPRQVAKDIGLDSAITELSKHGIADNIDDMAIRAEKVTGSDGILSKVVRTVVANADDQISLDDGISAAKNISEVNDGMFIRNPELKNRAMENIRNILTPDNKSISGKSGLEVALEAERKLQEIASAYRSSAFGGLVQSPNKISDEALYKMYHAAAQEIGQSIDESKVAQDLIAQVTKDPDLIASIKSISPRLADQFKGAKTIGDLRSLQRPFVSLLQAIRITSDQQSSVMAKGLGQGAQQVGKYLRNPLNILGDIADAYTPSVANIASKAQNIPAVNGVFNLLGKASAPTVGVVGGQTINN